jgi:acetylornithine deacetylase/succinyl-diaminopimelate desuccinylase-like protein
MSNEPSIARDTIVDVTSRLVAIPSVNPAIAPAEGTSESAVAEFARAWLQDHGVRATLEEAAPGRPNVVADVGAGDGPTLVLCAHLDTVGTEGMTIPPFEPRVDGDRLYGRGAYDMKASAAAIMVAMAHLAASHLGRVRAALVCDEEHASLGAFDFVRRHRADACIVTEPAEGGLVLAHKGFVWVDVVTTGRAAHGSRWDLGVSAIGRMAPIIAAIEAFDRDELRRRVHPLVGPASLHCALISGGTGLSTYAPECRLQIERRTLPGETPEQVREEIVSVVSRTGADARVEVAFARDPCVCDSTARIAGCVRDAVSGVTGHTPADAGVGFWMDAAVFAAAGVPTVNYGPVGDGAHAAVEWVDIPSVVRLAEVLVSATRRYHAA